MFNERHFFHNILTFVRIVSIFTWNSIKLLWIQSMLVYSANKIGIGFLFMTAGKSFMCKRNGVGPCTEPCGIPSLFIAHFESVIVIYFIIY